MSVPVARAARPAVAASESAARRWLVGGRVQGVGFRPFVYRLARAHQLTGWVRNTGGEVEIHAEGTAQQLLSFGEALLLRAPPAAAPTMRAVGTVAVEPSDEFRILASTRDETARIHVSADLFTCDECLVEL